MRWTRFKMPRVLLAASLGACAVASHANDPVRGGTLAVPIHVGEPATYDCHASNSPAVMWRLAPHYSTLVKINAERSPEVIGDLAKSWAIANDKVTYRFTLHPNIKFHDGSALTSQDVKASFDRMRNPPQGVVSMRQGMLADVVSIEAPDPLTVVFKFSKPNAAALQLLASPFGCIYSAKLMASDPS